MWTVLALHGECPVRPDFKAAEVLIGAEKTPLQSLNIRWWRQQIGFVGQAWGATGDTFETCWLPLVAGAMDKLDNQSDTPSILGFSPSVITELCFTIAMEQRRLVQNPKLMTKLTLLSLNLLK